jgi:hypothetical protein
VPARQRELSDTEAVERMRAALRDALPGIQAFFFTGGIVKRILNFGAPAPIDVEILGYDLERGGAYAELVCSRRCARPKGADGASLLTDVQITREENYPSSTSGRPRKGRRPGPHRAAGRPDGAGEPGGERASSPRCSFTDPKTGNEYNINVRLDDDPRTQVEDLDEVLLRAPPGASCRCGRWRGRALQRAPCRSPQVHAARGGRHRQRRPRQATWAPPPTPCEGDPRRAPPPTASPCAWAARASRSEAFSGLGFAGVLAVAWCTWCSRRSSARSSTRW